MNIYISNKNLLKSVLSTNKQKITPQLRSPSDNQLPKMGICLCIISSPPRPPKKIIDLHTPFTNAQDELQKRKIKIKKSHWWQICKSDVHGANFVTNNWAILALFNWEEKILMIRKNTNNWWDRFRFFLWDFHN